MSIILTKRTPFDLIIHFHDKPFDRSNTKRPNYSRTKPIPTKNTKKIGPLKS
jgi:hypothetical protein